MKSLVLFDSNFGNTKKIAEVIADELGKNAVCIAITKFKWSDLEGVELLIVGSPINGWKPTEKMGKLLDSLIPNQLAGMKAATFDTRIDIILHGDAAGKIKKKLEAAGALIISAPQAFMVSKTEGPLNNGEIEKASLWAESLRSTLQTHPKRVS